LSEPVRQGQAVNMEIGFEADPLDQGVPLPTRVVLEEDIEVHEILRLCAVGDGVGFIHRDVEQGIGMEPQLGDQPRRLDRLEWELHEVDAHRQARAGRDHEVSAAYPDDIPLSAEAKTSETALPGEEEPGIKGTRREKIQTLRMIAMNLTVGTQS
jgi:hypothetical protein